MGTINDEDNQTTIWQHYVPRMYMSNFGTIIQKKKKDVALICFYQFNKELMGEDVPVKSICAADYFYDEDNHIENMLSDKEVIWAGCFKAIIEGGGFWLTVEQRCLLKEFASYQYLRTHGVHKHKKEMFRELYYPMTNKEYPNFPEDVVKDAIRKRIDENITPDNQIEMADALLNEISDLEVRVIENKTEEPFITSDVPIIITNAFGNNGGGVANIGTIIMYPISEKYLIVIYDGELYKNVGEVLDNKEEVKKLNQYQVLSADERVIGKETIVLQRYVNDIKLMEQRNKTRNSKVTTNAISDDKGGIIINAKSRNVPYIALKMFSLQPRYKRIPYEAREVFPRKYNPKIREALLDKAVNIRRIYKEFLGDKLQNYDRKKIQNGYLELLNLYDEYWKVPIENRTKPIEVKIIHKPNRMNFFKIQE